MEKGGGLPSYNKVMGSDEFLLAKEDPGPKSEQHDFLFLQKSDLFF